MLTYKATLSLPLREKTLLQRADNFLRHKGYGQEKRKSKALVYTRGSVVGNLLVLNPKRWRTTIILKSVPRDGVVDILVEYHVSTAGHRPLPAEKTYFQNEFAALLKVLQTGRDIAGLDENAVQARDANLALVALVLLLMLAGVLTCISNMLVALVA